MKTRKLGQLEVSELGAGCMSISANYGPPADRTQGIDGHSYGPRERASRSSIPPRCTDPTPTRTLVGEALAPIRDQVAIATKFGFDLEAGGLNSRPEHIKEVVEGSLKRLQTDRIDLYYQHRVDPERADRRRGGRHQGPDPGRKGPALRPLRGERQNNPARACRSTGHGGADRILAHGTGSGAERRPRNL